jgi:hypothetical protein
MAVTNKWLLISKSRDDLNQCIPYWGKPDQHGTYVSHTSPCTPGVRFLRAVPVCDNLLWVTDKVGWILLLLRKSAPDSTSQSSWVARGTRLSFSPKTTIEAVSLSQAPVDGPLIGLPGPYHRHAISTFNTSSRVPTSWSLTDTGGGYHIENLRIATTLSPPYPFEGSTNPSNGPTRSQINHNNYQFSWEGTNPKSCEWELPLDFYHNLSSKHSITNGKPPKMGVTRINRKEDLNVSTVSSNSYKLNA